MSRNSLKNRVDAILVVYNQSVAELRVCTKPENLQTKETRDDIMVSTHMRGAVIPTSVYKGFLRAWT